MASVTWAVDSTIPGYFLSEISQAFESWSRYANISFQRVASAPGAEIMFTHSAIDGSSNILAQASSRYVGNEYRSSTVTFDANEGWRVDGDQVETARGTVDLYMVALHEIGHSIGINHTSGTPMIMNPSISLNQIHDLTINDIQAAQAIYGARAGAPAFDTNTGFNVAGSVVPPTTIAPPTVPIIPTLVASAPEAPTPPTAPTGPLEDTTDPVYRFFDTKTGDHFYTASTGERDSIIKNIAHYQYEGVAFETPDDGIGTVDVFRFYNTATDAHFFTSSVGERDQVIRTLPTFQYEGVAFQAYESGSHADAVVLDRFYNTATSMHHYSTGGETAGIVAGNAGPNWKLEGKSFVMATVGSDGHANLLEDSVYEEGSIGFDMSHHDAFEGIFVT